MYEVFGKVVRSARSDSGRLGAAIRKGIAMGVSFAFAIAPAASGLLPASAEAKALPARPQATASASAQCTLAGGAIKHVIYIQFDNVHFTRDNPSVPSDLEQMPHLLNFFVNNGTFSSNHHTPLIAHTADDIITSLTGVYGERHGQPVANSFNYFNPAEPDGLGSTFTSSFTYWTDPVDPVHDPTFSLLTSTGKNAPAPWVPFTRAGCNVGAVSIANMELENVGSDLVAVFASDPTQLAAAQKEASTNHNKAVADFEGIAIHCAAGNAVCSSQNHGEPDLLPDEPNGYSGFNALYGHTFVAPVIAPGGLNDLSGNPIMGFPGFGGISAAQSLAYTAAMHENGVPVTYSYIADAHDSHSFPFRAFGPGEAGYVAQLKAYDAAFATFFARLANDGITTNNSLFILTSDENDHFAGGPPLKACDGVNTPCTYTPGSVGPNTIGELLSNIQSLLGEEDPTLNFNNTPFDIHFDMAPVFYISGQPARDSAVARQFERDTAKLTAVNPRTGNTDVLTRFLADPVELKLLHMITGDPLRTPTYVMFGDPDYFFQTFGKDVVVNPGFAWNHGGVAPEINNTWLGLAGPGVKVSGVTNAVWSDHTDIRPTMLSLVGLQDDYASQGRVLAEDLLPSALPDGMNDSVNQGVNDFVALAAAYKRINAPVGDLGLASLKVSTAALAGDDATYNNLENQLQIITAARDALAARMFDRLSDAEFGGKHVSHGEALTMVAEANALIQYVQGLAQ